MDDGWPRAKPPARGSSHASVQQKRVRETPLGAQGGRALRMFPQPQGGGEGETAGSRLSCVWERPLLWGP